MAVTAVTPPAPAGRPLADPARPGRPPVRWERVGLGAWGALVLVALLWGTLRVADAGISLGAAPFVGHWGWHGGVRLLPAVLVGAGVVGWGPAIAAGAPWRAVTWSAGLAATAWAAALGASDGWDRLTAPLATRWEYEPFAATVGGLRDFLSGFAANLDAYPVHVKGHPPGPVVLAWALDHVGLGGAGWLAALALAAWGAAAGLALGAARAVAGEAAARRAAPALAVLPAAVWAATSLDALFAGLIAAACAAAVLAVARSSRSLAVGAGVLWGAALACTYGALPLLAVPAAALAARRGRPADAGRMLALLAAGALAVLALLATQGFWWPDGLAATGDAYWAGLGGQRPAGYLTLVGNPAALALATGPGVAVGLAVALAAAGRRVWHRAPVPTAALLPVAALVAVAAADLSQMSRGEVERIWLPFVPWLALAAPGDRRRWLAAQVALALTLQAALASPW